MNFYDRYILPPLTHYACGTRLLARHRAALIPAARGKVLEIGIGSALNLDYYSATSVSSLTGIDPSQQLLGYAAKRAKRVAFPVELIPARAESLPLPDTVFDTVVVTFSLCTIPDLAASLGELRRVLKPDGRLLFCEHGLAPDASVQHWQQRIDPLWGKIAGGCHLSRNIPELLDDAAFRVTELSSAYLPRTPRFAGYVYRGSAAIEPAK